MEIVNACYDAPSPLTYQWEEIAGNITSKPKKFPKLYVTVHNQGIDKDTQNACTRYGLFHINNGQNILEQGPEYKQVHPKEPWMRAVSKKPGIKEDGDYLQNALKQAKEEGYISGWSEVKTIEQAKQAIDLGQYIYTGSSNGDWGSVRDRKLYRLRTDGRIVGHAFCIVDYNDEGFIAINSYGPKNGYFTIPYDLWNTLFTKNAVIDMENRQAIDQKKLEEDNKTLQLVIELGIYSGKDAEQPIRREDAALMMGRVVRVIRKENEEMNAKMDRILELLETNSLTNEINNLIN